MKKVIKTIFDQNVYFPDKSIFFIDLEESKSKIFKMLKIPSTMVSLLICGTTKCKKDLFEIIS